MSSAKHIDSDVPGDVPLGVVRGMGTAVGDVAHIARDPGFSRWRLILAQADELVRGSGPLAWALSAFLGMFMTLMAAQIFSRFGIERGLAGLIISSMGLRELAVVVGTAGLAASAGAGYVTDIGAMRVGDEIDAMESMSVPSYPYLVSTRVWATLIGAVPVYIGCFAAMFLGGFFAATAQISGLNAGSYLRFFTAGFAPIDILYSLTKGIVAAVVIAIVASGRGYRTTGGPAGVGTAVGEAMNVSLILVMILNLLLSYLFWGFTDTVKL